MIYFIRMNIILLKKSLLEIIFFHRAIKWVNLKSMYLIKNEGAFPGKLENGINAKSS